RSPTRTKRSKPSAGNRGPQLDPQPTSVPQNGPDRLPALVAARLKPAQDAPRQPDEESRTRGPLRRRPQRTVTIRMDDAAAHAVPLPGSSGEKKPHVPDASGSRTNARARRFLLLTALLNNPCEQLLNSGPGAGDQVHPLSHGSMARVRVL